MADDELLTDVGKSRGERARLLGGDSDDEDDFFLNGPSVGTKLSQTNAIAELRGQVDSVGNLMRENVNKILERETRLSELEERSERLDDSAAEFRSQANRVRRRMWWEDSKMKLVLGGTISGVILLIIIISSL